MLLSEYHLDYRYLFTIIKITQVCERKIVSKYTASDFESDKKQQKKRKKETPSHVKTIQMVMLTNLHFCLLQTGRGRMLNFIFVV